MAIADTINSIRTHLETDYEALENIGAELENVDKNIENIASVVNGIYDNLPKTTGEGTNLSLTTLKGKMNIIPKGDTSQNGTPTPDTPIDIEVVTGTQTITISNSDNTETQTQTISLGDIELCKIGNYQDYLYKSNDKWYKKEYIGKVVFNGSETGWERNTTTLGYRYRINQSDIKPNADTSTIASMYCNYLRATSPDKLYNTDNYSISCFSGTSHVIIIACVDSNTDTLEKWKTWLSTHNTIVYYPLETPQDIEITNTNLITQLNNLEKAQSYNGTTNISSIGNLSAILSVSALKGE